MPEIVYICECGKIYHFHKRFAGRTSRCINCRRDYVVPLISETDEPPLPEEMDIEDIVTQTFSSESDTFDGITAPTPESEWNEENSTRIPSSISDPSKHQDAAPKRLGKYEIHEKIGAGGMGNVYYAQDTELRRQVTVKTTNAKSRRHGNYRERFINEARITGRLVHSGIITIYSLDFDETGEPYYAMRLLEGRTLEQLTTQYHNLNSPAHTPEQLRKLVRHFIDVCQTVAYAHDNLVVHRDIKPANIMLGGYGETVVLDWGLAKILTGGQSGERSDDEVADTADDLVAMEDTEDGTPDLTMMGARVGTAGYQSPEYLRGEDSQPSDDLYALGVTLYFILCNKLPYPFSKDRRGVYEMMMTPPRPPHLDNHHVTRPLSAICLCALAFDKAKRYPTADHLAADLQRWLDGEPVRAYRMKTGEKILSVLQRNALLFAATTAMFVAGFLLSWMIFGK